MTATESGAQKVDDEPTQEISSESVWTPVEILWNGEPFMVELKPTCVLAHDLDIVSIEGYYGPAEDWPNEEGRRTIGDRIARLHALRLVGSEKTLEVDILLDSPCVDVPRSINTTGESNRFHENGAIVLDGETVNIDGCRVCDTVADDQKLITALKQARSAGDYILEGTRYAIKKGGVEVRDKMSGETFAVSLFISQIALAHMATHCPKESQKQSGYEIVAAVLTEYADQYGERPDGYAQVIHLFRKAEETGSNRRQKAGYYGDDKLVRNSGKTGFYWLEVNI